MKRARQARPSTRSRTAQRGPVSLPIKLVLAESYPLLLIGTEQTLCADFGFRVLESCGDAAGVMRAVRLHRPDVLLLDIDLPGHGLKVLRELIGLPTRVIVLAQTMS